MHAHQFSAILKVLPEFSSRQMVQLEQAVRQARSSHQIGLLLEIHARQPTSCPYCHHQYPIRYGTARGLQRYRCNSCRRTFTQLSGTPLSGLHYRKCWPTFAQALQEQQTLAIAANNCGIHIHTALRWRHRFLDKLLHSASKQLGGIIEADETFLRQSFKGQHQLPRPAYRRTLKAGAVIPPLEQTRILVARDRNRQTLVAALPRLRYPELFRILRPLMAEDSILCTDGGAVYAAFSRRAHIQHEMLLPGARVRGPYHIQNVNNYHSRLKEWLTKFHGVATHHLPKYLAWFNLKDRCSKHYSAEDHLMAALGMS